MRLFYDLPIRWKLSLVATLVSILVLVFAFTVMLGYEFLQFQHSALSHLKTLARIIGANSCSAILFRDSTAADDTLLALRSEKHIIAVRIYDGTGKVLAAYGKSHIASSGFGGLKDIPYGEKAIGKYFTVYHPIKLQDETVGAIFLQADASEMQARMKKYAEILAAFMLASSLLALGLSSCIQGLISGPILKLASVAKKVSENKDYSARVDKSQNDEVGLLVDSFNDMLSEIQARDKALQEAHSELEKRVE